jgi:type I restriction enzyme S subunit
MNRIDALIRNLCPDGVPRRELGSLGKRNTGTAMTAAKMKLIGGGGPIRVFAGGNTVADVAETAVPAKDVVRVPSIIVKSRGHIGFSYYEAPFTHKTELWSYSISDPDVDQKFVYYYLLTQLRQLQALARATSVKLPQLSVKDTDTLRIPVPPLQVQRYIVRILDRFTQVEAELEAKLRAELDARQVQYAYHRDSLVRAVEGQRVAMGEVGTFIRGRRFTKSDVVEAGIPSIHYGEIYTDYGVAASRALREVRSDLVGQLRFAQPRDVVFAGVGETVEDVGKAVAWLGDGPVAVHDDTFSFTSGLNPKYVAYAVQTDDFHAQKANHVARGKVKRLSAAGLAKIKIPVPCVEEQERIVSILDHFDALINDLNVCLPVELNARRTQYEYYRDRLLTFKELAS